MDKFQRAIDVAKAKLDCALRHKVVENSPVCFTALRTWLMKQGVGTLPICREAVAEFLTR
jgi:hypothetical protein